jgi:hypothetical protein
MMVLYDNEKNLIEEIICEYVFFLMKKLVISTRLHI